MQMKERAEKLESWRKKEKLKEQKKGRTEGAPAQEEQYVAF